MRATSARKSARPAGKTAATHTDHSSTKTGLAPRLAAARLLAAVIDKATPLDALTDDENGNPAYIALEPRDRGLCRAILLTALRHRGSLEALIADRLDRPLPPNARALEHLLHVGAAQIVHLSVPDSAAVDLAVTAAQGDPRLSRFASLVNAVLRGLTRMSDEKREAVAQKALNAPQWFAAALTRDYGEESAAAILQAHQMEASVDLTVKANAERWAEELGARILPNGSLRLPASTPPIPALPGFEEGAWWVQDAAATIPARLIGATPSMKVADLCAAPGGKTAQIALSGAAVTALDLSASRLRRLEDNLRRLDLSAKTVAADLRKWAPDEAFDAVLLDAPCSSTGTARRHPDVLWTKSDAVVERMAALQAVLLQRCVDLVRPGGTIVFANCSLDRREGEAVARAFEALEAIEPLPVSQAEIPGFETAITGEGWVRTTPANWAEIGGVDGFFAARFRRI
ncbi:RsmB/NOP family class I SAM-dependent RNA methyltransferase [Notoacmeibacter ruber]|uniref:MFS transporter n=1 Tax=Notoacmeibacter ruber TaxID=2670375 RepID=A0A3L7JE70_9HYPH|nr:RsmB/NOP family class I SAM-dependent RNA methyltransferase [Notoacmeibacter ruber]RLQ88976.1 MFS transporter [Notoacmeibacter ruber]